MVKLTRLITFYGMKERRTKKNNEYAISKSMKDEAQ